MTKLQVYKSGDESVMVLTIPTISEENRRDALGPLEALNKWLAANPEYRATVDRKRRIKVSRRLELVFEGSAKNGQTYFLNKLVSHQEFAIPE